MSSELEILREIQAKAALPRASRVALGIGDDCAIYRPPGSTEELLFTTDLLIEDVHFRRETHSAAQIGYKTLARGLSDLAGMGAKPQFCLLSLALPEWADGKWVRSFYRGLLELSRSAGAPLAGGDLARAEKLTCDIVACGAAPHGKSLRRSGARPGDAVYVSGVLGGSAIGFRTGTGAAWKRHVRPEPRLALGLFVREKLGASAAMDLSDGLSLDLHRLCLASGVSAAIEAPPRFPGATLEHSLHGGEDYELLFTVRNADLVPARFEGLQLTRIGTIHKGRPGAVSISGLPLPPLGFDHFRK
ncbi:MAG: thiamine-phosphate kinase [Acidobacteriota bacterium]|nr:thiamine-phosphate kinase [Acidobacteriota bacterium]